METLFIPKASQSYLEIIIFIVMFLGIAIIRNTNNNYTYFLINNFTLKKDSFYKSLSTVNLNNKSTIFLNLNFLVASSLYLYKIYNVSYFSILFILVLYKLIQAFTILVLEKVFLGKSEIITFIKRRFALTELIGIVTLIFLFFTHYLNPEKDLLILLGFMALTAIWAKVVVVLSYKLSVFHIILYLCTLEILPILFLAKFIYKHLA